MKKNYISPEAICLRLNIETLMDTPSITPNKTDLDHDIYVGGKAGDGESSDSRRPYNVWDDEEEEQQY